MWAVSLSGCAKCNRANVPIVVLLCNGFLLRRECAHSILDTLSSTGSFTYLLENRSLSLGPLRYVAVFVAFHLYRLLICLQNNPGIGVSAVLLTSELRFSSNS